MSGQRKCSKDFLARQRGAVAVEMALLSILIATIFLVPIMVAHSLMQATLAQRATYNAAHVIAAYPQYQRLDPSSFPADEAKALLMNQLSEGGLLLPDISNVSVACTGSANCRGPAPPAEILVTAYVDVLRPATSLPVFDTIQVSITSWDRYAN